MGMRARSVQPVARRVALLLACLFLWLSGGATLSHTDDLAALRAFAAGADAVRHVAPAPPAAPCAACQWEQTVPTLYAPADAVVRSPQTRTRTADAVRDALHLRPFDHVGLRAPPAPLS